MSFSVFRSGVVLEPDASAVRVALRIYFTVAILIITLIGSKICSLYPKLALARHGRVRILQMTGWLSAFDAAWTMWITRSNSLGLMGFFMILTGTIMTISDLTTSGLVNPIDVPDRCPVDMSTSFWTIHEIDPSANITNINGYISNPFEEGAKAIVETEAINQKNGGIMGIYHIIDRDPQFRAEQVDVLGSWRCKNLGLVATYNYTTNMSTIRDDMSRRGLVYGWAPQNNTVDRNLQVDMLSGMNTEDGLTYVEREIDIFTTNHSYSDTGQSETPWDVLMALQHIGDVKDVLEDKQMYSYHCRLQAPKAEWIWYLMNPSVTLSQWLPLIHNTVYKGPYRSRTVSEDAVSLIESGLNIIYMSVGASYGANGTNIDRLPVTVRQNATKGCLIAKTVVPWPIILLIALVGLMLLASALALFVLRLLVHRETKLTTRPCGARSLNPPIGLTSWLKYAVDQKNANHEGVMSWNLAKCEFMMTDEHWKQNGTKTWGSTIAIVGGSKADANPEASGHRWWSPERIMSRTTGRRQPRPGPSGFTSVDPGLEVDITNPS
jgi:hypothetical protein